MAIAQIPLVDKLVDELVDGDDTSDIPLHSDFTNRIRVEDESKNILHSCCGGATDKRLITILAQVCFSGLVLIEFAKRDQQNLSKELSWFWSNLIFLKKIK